MPRNHNETTVFVIQNDNHKDLSDAKRYGKLQAVFGNPRKPYNTANMLTRARDVLKEWKDGDFLLMLGDPALCGVCMTVASEYSDIINVLSWDNYNFEYISQEWNLNETQIELEFS